MTFCPVAAGALATRILEIAEEVERAELAIKKRLVEAADRGDVRQVSRLLRRWMEVPVAEVLRENAPASTKRQPDRKEP